MNTKCLIHIERQLEMYCRNCTSLICSKCFFSQHKEHNVVDYEDFYLELKSKDVLKTLESKRNLEELKFKKEVGDQHNEQIGEITSKFREFHDNLHVKEVELKKELQSYYEENQETFSTLLSMHNYDINLETLKQRENNDKLSLISSYITNIKQKQSTIKDRHTNNSFVYNIYQRNKNSFESLQNAINNIGIEKVKNISLIYGIEPSKYIIRKDFPYSLNRDNSNKSNLTFDDNVTICYYGPNIHTVLVRSTSSIPRDCGIYYFEVTFIHFSNASVGLCLTSMDDYKSPGYGQGSIGYCSNQRFYVDNNLVHSTWEPYKEFDTIGCCINFNKSLIFFTKNGIEQPEQFKRSHLNFDLFPCVGLQQSGEAQFNFGTKPFKYNIDKYYSEP